MQKIIILFIYLCLNISVIFADPAKAGVLTIHNDWIYTETKKKIDIFISSNGGEYPTYKLIVEGKTIYSISEINEPFFIENGKYAIFPFSEIVPMPGLMIINTKTFARKHVLKTLWIQKVFWKMGTFQGIANNQKGEFQFNVKIQLP